MQLFVIIIIIIICNNYVILMLYNFTIIIIKIVREQVIKRYIVACSNIVTSNLIPISVHAHAVAKRNNIDIQQHCEPQRIGFREPQDLNIYYTLRTASCSPYLSQRSTFPRGTTTFFSLPFQRHS